MTSRERLINCFSTVFSDLSAEEIVRARADHLDAWDSLATVTLAAVVEEEFDILFDPEELERLDSFQAFSARVLR